MGEEILDTNNSVYWKLLATIAELKNKKIKTIPELAKEINIATTHAYFQQIIKFLLKKNFLIIGIVGRTRLIKEIKYKKLAELLRDSVYFKHSGKLIEMTRGIYIY